LKTENILILGDGLLGGEIKSQTNWDIISRRVNGFDFNQNDCLTISYDGINDIKAYDIIINCIANTNTYSDDRDSMLETNYKSVYRLALFCNEFKIKLVHIGTDFVYANNSKELPSESDVPVHAENWYSYSKLLADGVIELISKDYLICRCTHKPYPFPFKKAFTDRIGNFDYTFKIAQLIIKLIKLDASGLYNTGTEVKSMYDLVKGDCPGIEPTLSQEGIPKKTAMSIEKLKNLCGADFF